jgi:6-phosphogluconate dehydrogenase (decarboxylating)
MSDEMSQRPRNPKRSVPSRMGAGMAANLLTAGHQVTVYNRTPGKAKELIAQSAKAAASVGEACRGDAVWRAERVVGRETI